LSEIICQSCGKNSKIVLVGQIYAPIEGLDRSLYVFVCNSRACSLSSRGWTIIRNQKPSTIEDKPKDIISPVESKLKAVVDNTSIWNFSSDLNGLEEDIDLLELLNKRDTKLQTPSSAQKQKNQGSAKKNKSATVKSPFKENPVNEQLTSGDKEDNKPGFLSILPEFQITEVEDPFDEYTALGGNQPNENELIPFDKNLDSRHIQYLLDSYMKEEDDVEALQALQAYQRSRQANNSTDETNELLLKPRAEEETTDNSSFFDTSSSGLLKKNNNSLDKTVSKKKSKPKSGLKKIQEDKEDDENDDDEEEDGEDDRMGNGDETVEEKMSEKQKTEFYFQQRISVESNQVLRYCYNGKPLWITSPSPLDPSSENKKREIIPCCPCCGEKRVYECQLMPAILSLISSSSSDKKGGSSSLPADSSSLTAKDLSNELRERLGDEFDFGVVTVWSCPNSCPPSPGGTDKFAVEIAIVQPPPDISVW
jgi:hypothetical protein